MTACHNSQVRELTPEETDLASGGASAKAGPLNVYAGEAGIGVTIDGVGSLWIGSNGQVCGSIGSVGGCTPAPK